MTEETTNLTQNPSGTAASFTSATMPFMQAVRGLLEAMAAECKTCLYSGRRCSLCYSPRAKILLNRMDEDLALNNASSLQEKAVENAIVERLASRKSPPVRACDLLVRGLPHGKRKTEVLQKLVARGILRSRRLVTLRHHDVVYWLPKQDGTVLPKLAALEAEAAQARNG